MLAGRFLLALVLPRLLNVVAERLTVIIDLLLKLFLTSLWIVVATWHLAEWIERLD